MFDVRTENLKEFENRFRKFPQATVRAAQMAINDTLRKMRTKAATEISKQVRFPTGYLNRGDNARLKISQYARGNGLRGEITGRFNPTSLARFTRNAAQMAGRNRRGPARVAVKPGSIKTIERAFVMRLRRGNISAAEAGANANLGLAIRLKPGETLKNKKQAKAISNGVYLLYGPSVNQVFRDVAKELQAPASRTFAAEFDRQFRRLTRV